MKLYIIEIQRSKSAQESVLSSKKVFSVCVLANGRCWSCLLLVLVFGWNNDERNVEEWEGRCSICLRRHQALATV